MFYDFIKIHGYDGILPTQIDPGSFEVFQGISGSSTSSTTTNTESSPFEFTLPDGMVKEIVDFLEEYGLTATVDDSSQSRSMTARGLPAVRALPAIFKALVKWFPWLIEKFKQFPLQILVILQICKEIMDIFDWISDVIQGDATRNIEKILDTALLEGTIIKSSILNNRLSEIRDAIEQSDMTALVTALQELRDAIKLALIENVAGEDQSILKNYLAKINAAIEALQYNEEVVDFGFLRVLLKGKVIEY